MNSYPDPTQDPSGPFPIGEPQYREYPSAPPQPYGPVYPPAPSFPPGYPPVGRMPVPPMGTQPYPYGPAGQPFQPPTPQPIPSFPVAKKSSRGWILLLSGIGVAILLLVGVLIYAFSSISSSNSIAANPTSTPSGGTTSKPGVVKVGQSLTVSGLTCTVTSVKPLDGDGKTNPTAGNKFMVVHVQLHNNTSTTLYYDPIDFHVFNGDNQEHDVEDIVPTTYTQDQQLQGGDLSPGDTTEGDLIIQVPVNDHNVKLGWGPGAVTDDAAYEWDLGL
jgi:Domain of unknown function (DUF4352)